MHPALTADDAALSARPSQASRSSRGRRLRTPLALLGATAAATAYLGVVDPDQPGHYPVCPFLQLTGLWCPGCGGLRAVHALTRGDLSAALHDNALGVLFCAFLAGFWSLWTVRAARGLPRPGLRLSRPWAVALLGLVLAFTVLRNVPTGAFLAP